MYADVFLVIEGALDEQSTFKDECALNDYIRTLQDEHKTEGWNGALYVLWHEHDPQPDCGCSEYLTDHRPYVTFGPK